jgi:hypothetical protein
MSVSSAPGSRVKSLILFEEASSGVYVYGRVPKVVEDLQALKTLLDCMVTTGNCRDMMSSNARS